MALVVNYYQTLIDVGLFLFFVIGAKVVILFTIRVPKPSVPRARRILWTGFGVWWLLSGVLQIFPWTVTHSPGALSHALYRYQPLSVIRAYHFFLIQWTSQPVTWNILAVIFQVLFGIMLLTEAENIAGRITLALAAVFAGIVWVIPEALGGMLSWPVSAAAGAPGAGLVAVVTAVLLLLPAGRWSASQTPERIRQGLSAFFAVAAVVEANPWSGLWGEGIAKIFAVSPVPWAQKLIGNAAQMAHNGSVVYNGVLAACFLSLAVVLWKNTGRWLTLGLAGALLLWIWATGEGFGLVPSVGANAGTAPLLFGLIMIAAGRPMGMTEAHTGPQTQQ